MSNTFGDWVAMKRHWLRLKAIECCLRSGISKSQWSQIEHKDKPREISTLKKIAVGLGIDFNEVLSASLAADGIECTAQKEEENDPDLHNRLSDKMKSGLKQLGDKYR